MKTFFQKTGVPFLVEKTMKTQYFYIELPCQKPMLRQIEWGVQNETITKNGILSVTTLRFCFSIRS